MEGALYRELLRHTLASGALVCKRAKCEVLMKNIVWCGVTSQLCDTVLLVAAFVEMLLYIHPPLHVHSL